MRIMKIAVAGTLRVEAFSRLAPNLRRMRKFLR
jgi:hypothetical protein